MAQAAASSAPSSIAAGAGQRAWPENLEGARIHIHTQLAYMSIAERGGCGPSFTATRVYVRNELAI